MEATGLAGRIDGHHRQTRLGQLSCAMIPLTLTGLRNRGWLDHHRSIINSINQTTNLAILTRTRDELDAWLTDTSQPRDSRDSQLRSVTVG